MTNYDGFLPPTLARGTGNLRAQTERLVRELQNRILDMEAGIDFVVRGDIEADTWNGTSPADLSSDLDATADAGYYIDASEGAAQFAKLYVGRKDVDYWIVIDPTTHTENIFIYHEDGGRINLDVGGGSTYTTLSIAADSPGTTASDPYLELIGNDTLANQEANLVAYNASLKVKDEQVLVSRNSTDTAAKPRLAFSDDPDTGIYRIAANTLGFAVGGNEALSINSSGVRTAGGTTGAPLMYNGAGTEGNPAFTFAGDDDSGVYRRASNAVAISVGGNRTFEVVTNQTKTLDGSNSTPGFSFINDPDTGIYLAGTNTLGFASAGALVMQIVGTNMTLPSGMTVYAGGANPHWVWWTSGGTEVIDAQAVNDLTTGSAANVNVGASGNQMRRSTSSIAYKPGWEFADEEALADLELPVPIVWEADPEDDLLDEHRTTETTRQVHLGFGTEHVAAALPHAVVQDYRNHKPENYDVRSLVAILSAKVKRLERQLPAQEEQWNRR